jgi:DNA-damage-inducible protein D
MNHQRSELATDIQCFEDHCNDGEAKWWNARDLQQLLGYEDAASFSRLINRAIASCAQLGVEIFDAFTPYTATVNGRQESSYKLTRFACLLIVMHADDKKPEVAKAKVHFAALASTLIDRAIGDEDLPRVEIRDQLKASEKMLSGVAKSAGVEGFRYAMFKDAGFRGMYDMSLKDLMRKKGVGGNYTLYDFMGASELSGNYFRVTQTVDHIRNTGIRGQQRLQNAAMRIGSDVRASMIRNTKIAPENLPISEDINKVKTRLRQTNRKMVKLDEQSIPSKRSKLSASNAASETLT